MQPHLWNGVAAVPLLGVAWGTLFVRLLHGHDEASAARIFPMRLRGPFLEPPPLSPETLSPGAASDLARDLQIISNAEIAASSSSDEVIVV